MSALTSVSTPAVDTASVPASTPVSAFPPIPKGGTTGKKFSVAEYYERQNKKLELKAKQRAEAAKQDSPKTIFDGSSVLSADGGIPVDYEDGELEDEATSSSQSHEFKPATGSRRPREEDSDASSSKRPRCASDVTRTDDTVREPWMPSEKVIKDRYGALVPPNPIPRYFDNRIVDDAEAVAKHLKPGTDQRRDYYISLFHELRYWSSNKTSGRSKVPEWQALCQSWNQFDTNFNNDPAGYRERIVSARERFAKFSVTSAVQRVHDASVNAKIPCAVPDGVHCPHCSHGAPRISERDLTGYTVSRVPANVKELRAKLSCTRQHPNVVPVYNTPRNTAPRSVTPRDRVGLRTPSPFPERPTSGRFGETMYLDGEPIVSNEFENEPDLGSSSGLCDQQSDPLRGGSGYRGQGYASAGGVGCSSYDRPQALEDVHAVVFAALKQQLHLLNASMCEAAQTIRVEMPQLRVVQSERLLVVRGQNPSLES
ncbi:hypothetical protein PHMEG_00026213 [Phytophthora megakarya]|uniref:Uncharacterized protein n=1 Tax=Phytophthora megakarya TaxID=4795 RepID=A0A225V924_9STRA|nr:hypothetical protein PHMEG_00026213 [Phytophthora megakarya]